MDICTGMECIQASAEILSAMNQEASPCDNFYEFVCGNYMEGKSGERDQFSSAQENNIERLSAILSEEISSRDSKTSKLAKTFYQSCMDYRQIEEQGTRFIKSVFEELNGWPCVQGEGWSHNGTFDWAKLRKSFIVKGFSDPVFNNIITGGSIASPTFTYDIDGPKFIIEPKHLIAGRNETRVERYYQYMVNMAVLFGANRSTAEKDMSKVLQFEMSLARNISNQTTSEEELTTVPEPELLEKVPLYANYSTEWVKTVGFDFDLLVAENQVQATNFRSKVNETDNRTIANYMFWHAVHESAPYLSSDIRREYEKFESADIPKSFSGRKRSNWCIDESLKRLPAQMNAIYARKYFPTELRLSVYSIFEKVLRVISDSLQHSFLDEYTRINAVKKLNETDRVLNYNQIWFDEEELDKASAKYQLNSSNFLQNKLALLWHPEAILGTSKSLTVINAQNVPHENKIG